MSDLMREMKRRALKFAIDAIAEDGNSEPLQEAIQEIELLESKIEQLEMEIAQLTEILNMLGYSWPLCVSDYVALRNKSWSVCSMP